MRLLSYPIALALTVSVCSLAQAQEAAPASPAAAAPVAASAVTRGALLQTADGKRLGKIDRVVTAEDGSVRSVGLILDSRYVYVPGNTLTTGESGVTTSLTKAEARKLK